MFNLKKNKKFTRRQGPVVLIIMDGVGIGKQNEGNAKFLARTPNLEYLTKNYAKTELKAHGRAVGLPSDSDMGNSEVGHNALGAGRIFDQGAKLVSNAVESGEVFKTETWKKLISNPLKNDKQMHFIGLLSDGNVHSHIDHLFSLIEGASKEGIKKVKVHILLDGRDVPETSALEYVDRLEQFLENFTSNGLDYKIASGGGRMVTTMDRYEADWNIVKRGWDAHVLGKARYFASAREAIETFRDEDQGITDQYLPSFTVCKENEPVGKIKDGDSVIFFNFRGDRAIEITKAFEDKNFGKFDREFFPEVMFAGMMGYDGDLHIPANYIVSPPSIEKTMSEYLVNEKVRQYAISETQKFGHVTYFWNGNRSGKFDEKLETYFEVPSDRVEFDQRPWMKAEEITVKVIEVINSNKYDFIRLNYANGDMVGHTGHLEASVIAVEVVDLCIERLIKAIKKANGIAVITADHGNLDEMFETDKNGNFLKDEKTGEFKKKTSHTLNPVPFIIFDPGFNNEYHINKKLTDPGIGNVASTIMQLLGFEPPEDYLPSLIEFK
ncbi:MAG: 2,3-bisphosphoglycerate-independent phosphoglycerate mutase [Spirochaetes bacterium]|nr:2,3-bisphosphoglycerate-independent phosphoglycerate mutase [Spirochaetota bacterium]